MTFINSVQTRSLDEGLQHLIKLSCTSTQTNMILLMPTYDLQRYAFNRLGEFLCMLPEWFVEHWVCRQRDVIEFANENFIRVLNRVEQCRGISIDYCAMYLHPPSPWKEEDLVYLLPMIRGPLHQHFYYVV